MSAVPGGADRDALRDGFTDAKARLEYVRLCLGCVLVAFTSAHSTLLAVVFEREGFDLHAIGLLLSIIAAPVIGFALLSGLVMERLGALATLRLAMALTLLGVASFHVTRASFWPAMGSRIVQGAGQGLFLAAAYTYAQSRLTAARFLFLLGVFSATMPLAQAVAPPLGGFVLHRGGDDWLFPLASAPALFGLALTFGLRALPKPPRAGGLHLFRGLPRGSWEPLVAVLVNGTMMGFCLSYLAAALVSRSVPLAAFFTASPVTMFGSRLLALRRIERADRRVLVGLGLSLLGLGFVAVAFAGEARWPVVLGGVTFGFGYSLTYPVISAWISEGVEPHARAGPQAVLNAFFNIGLFAMPLPETWLVAALGYDGTMLLLSALALAFALLLALRAANRRRPIHKQFK